MCKLNASCIFSSVQLSCYLGLRTGFLLNNVSKKRDFLLNNVSKKRDFLLNNVSKKRVFFLIIYLRNEFSFK